MAWVILGSYSFLSWDLPCIHEVYMLINFYFSLAILLLSGVGEIQPITQSVVVVVTVQSLSCVWLFVTPWTAAYQASLSFTISQTLFNSCPSSLWCHPTISSSVVPFSSRLQSLPASGSFPMRKVDRERMIFPPLKNPAMWDHYIIPVTPVSHQILMRIPKKTSSET